MSYRIDAFLQQGIPSLRLLDAHSGKERLFWQQPVTDSEDELRHAWRLLFRRLALLSCIDQGTRNGGQRENTHNLTQREIAVNMNVGQQMMVVDSAPENAVRSRADNIFFLPLKQRRVVR
jgi:hypothetical protein